MSPRQTVAGLFVKFNTRCRDCGAVVFLPLVLPLLLYRALSQQDSNNWEIEFLSSVFNSTLIISVLFPAAILLLWCWVGVRHFLIPRRLAEFCAVWYCWNTHLIAYAAFMLPISLLLPSISPSRCTVVYLIFVTFVSSPPLLMTGGGKILNTKISGLPWDFLHKLSITAVASISVLYGWQHAYSSWSRSEFLVLVGMSLVYFSYLLLTGLDLPEVSGRRKWPYVEDLTELWGLVIFRSVVVLMNSSVSR